MSEPERDPLFYWRENNVRLCRYCQGIAIGANQCVKPYGRNLVILDHVTNGGSEVIVEAADVDDLLKAVQIARKLSMP